MEQSTYLDKIKRLLTGVQGEPLPVEERREKAIELSALLLAESRRVQTSFEHRMQAQLVRMVGDPQGKVFVMNMTDECFRSRNAARVADQLTYLLDKFGIPKFLSYFTKLQLLAFKYFGNAFPKILVPIAKHMLRRETKTVVLPGERSPLARHMSSRRKEGVRINLNRLGEAILGEQEAERRLQVYLEDLAHPEVEYISVKISTICSQLNLLAWEDTMQILEKRLRKLYGAAMQHTFVRPGGKGVPKFVNLDMENYSDLHLTVDVFRRVLDDPEFYQFSAGIVLQSYLPDSYLMQQDLTVWAMRRVANGGAPIKIRIVRGANLGMEKVDASLHGWEQATYTTKGDVDANFKRMIHYGFTPEHARAAKIGVASHNLFDIAYALLLRAEMGIEKFVEFEMLEGMADHVRRVIQAISGDILLYCPAVTGKEFHNGVSYLVRRLDENTAPENFLRHLFGMFSGTKEWQEQANHFSLACHAANAVSFSPRRSQNRFNEVERSEASLPFRNEPDTDWSLTQNRKWAENLLREWSEKELEPVPVVLGGKVFPVGGEQTKIGKDPSRPGVELYQCALADSSQVDKALKVAGKAHRKWAATPMEERSRLLATLAQLLRENRGELIGAMVADGGKIVSEADVEVSEAIDFVEYYRRNILELDKMGDIRWQSKGTVLVAPPWNFPCAIPVGGIIGALVAGNCVLFKPALETAYVGWLLAQLCWEAGIRKEVLQFLLCETESVGSQLIQDPRLAGVVLTGATATAKKMLKLRPGLDLVAETGGKNAMIITSMSDRDLAVRDLIQSAFGHAGQKCSACSLAICEAEVYDDRHFREILRDAAESLRVGSAWNLATSVNPLIHEPNETLLQGLTTLEEGEEWLLEPVQDAENPNLWSPGIKLGVREGSFTHQNELFGPVLALMRADNLDHAIKLANGTHYGLTSGIHTLDEREQNTWTQHIEAGNCYINRGITGAIVERQPFGGCKESSFGRGFKVGGPNYLMQMMAPEQIALPAEREAVSSSVNVLSLQLEKVGVTSEQMELWNASVESYAYYWKHYFSKRHDSCRLLGQDNLLYYTPHSCVVLRVQNQDEPLDVMRAIAAAMTCQTPLRVSVEHEKLQTLSSEETLKLANSIEIIEETEDQFVERLKTLENKRIRLLSYPSLKLSQELAEAECNAIVDVVSANGRVELLRFLREVGLSINYHRYGNLGIRENEERAPVL